jgi:nicotinate-nucleotide adenylyltransferase
MRIAFFGGTFDPPHYGHLAIARAAADCLRLDKVLFAPVGKQPLKQDSSVASFEDRVAMVRLAIEEDTRFEVSTLDAPRPDGHPNYTVDTILGLKKSLSPQDQLFCLIGADSFLSVAHWYRAAELLFACDFIVAGRPGAERLDVVLQNARQTLPQGVRISSSHHHQTGLLEFSLTNDTGQHSALFYLPDLHEEVSATAVRSSFAERSLSNDALPEQVSEYIRAHHLYY